MPLQATSGAASYDAFGGGVAAVPNYIEECFSAFLYTGNGDTQTITNGIDLSTKGGLVWVKSRSASYDHAWFDTARGATSMISSSSSSGQNPYGSITGINFASNGFSFTDNNNYGWTNTNSTTYASWTFRKQPKFFDVVTYTGNGTAGRQIAHSLSSVPGCIIIKCTSTTDNWIVYHRSIGNTKQLTLNTTDAQAGSAAWNTTDPTSTVFTVGLSGTINGSGRTYVAYLFAHDAGGFGLTGTDNVISCGSYTGTGAAGNFVSLGYEPQWVMVKVASSADPWVMEDNMRGMPVGGTPAVLYANSANAEFNGAFAAIDLQPTGFSLRGTDNTINASGQSYIYIAIRRGPMKVPTSGTSVFGLNARSGTGANATVTGGQTDDVAVIKARDTGQGALWAARLTATGYAQSSATSAIAAAGTTILQANPWDVMDGVKVGTTSAITNASTATYINYLFKRAPSFMDVVCYAGIDPSIEHNLGVTPEMYIVKPRDDSGLTGGRWYVYHTGYNTSSNYIALNTTDALTAATIWGSGPTSSVIGATGGTKINQAGFTYIAYLFATLAGVSKVGSYTGTGALQTINCGFTGGARFVLIKRTDSTGDWYTYDSARGLSSSTDPYFFMNSSSAETTGTNYVDTDSTGFKVTAAAPAELNASGGNYIFLAIA